MSVKIIESGKKEFIGYCKRCGCKFSYDIDDISLLSTVCCPECGAEYIHPEQIEQAKTKEFIYTDPIIETLPYKPMPRVIESDTCEDCDFYKQVVNDGKPYVGDLPCQWCAKNPVRITCESNTSNR